MATRLILLYQTHNSYAFMNCEPWTRLLVEVDLTGDGAHSSTGGYVIPTQLRLGKVGHPRYVGVRYLVVEQLEGSAIRAQRALDACAWWLGRAPLGVLQLDVKLTRHGHVTDLVQLPNWRVTILDLASVVRGCGAVDLRTVASLLPHLEALHLTGPATVRTADQARPILHPELLARCTERLEHVTLRGTRGVDNLQWIASAPALCSLDLAGCLSITDFAVPTALAALEVFRADRTGLTDLTLLRGSPCVREVCVPQCHRLHDFSSLASASRRLTSLDASFTSFHSLDPLRRSYGLETLRVEGCVDLESLAVLAGFPFLQHVHARGSGVHDLKGLGDCPRLAFLDVRECRRLRSLSDLEGAPALHTVKASISLVEELTGLAACPHLQDLHVSDCAALTDLSTLAGAASLTKLNASRSDVRALTGLHRCAQLGTVFLDHNTSLAELSGLAGAPSLTVLNASNTAVTCLDGLSTCPHLRDLRLGGCHRLTDISALAHSPSLTELSLVETGVRDLDGLHLCSSLAHLDVSCCAALEDLSSLDGAPALVSVTASHSGVKWVHGLTHSPLLSVLFLDGCASLEDVSPLAQCSALAIVDISDTPVATVAALARCPHLRVVAVRGCRRLRDASSVNGVCEVRD